MAYKKAKRTKTGKTIRNLPVSSAGSKYGCLVIRDDSNKRSSATCTAAKELRSCLPTNTFGNNVEYSLNKQKRWELPDYIKSRVELDSENRDVEISLVEHEISAASRNDLLNSNTCKGYYSNDSNIKDLVSKNQMNIKSVKQGYREYDHLTKLERRFLRKATDADEQEADQESDLSALEFHVGYYNRKKVYKGLALKNCGKKSMNSSKFRERRYLEEIDVDDLYYDDSYENDSDYDSQSDSDDDWSEQRRINQPITATLAECMKAATIPTIQRSFGSRNSFDHSTEHKKKVVYSDDRDLFVTPQRNSVPNTKPYTPRSNHYSDSFSQPGTKPVQCRCGRKCCSECLKEPHWPMTCDQFSTYMAILRERVLEYLVTSEKVKELSYLNQSCLRCQSPSRPYLHNQDDKRVPCRKCRAVACRDCGQLEKGREMFYSILYPKAQKLAHPVKKPFSNPSRQDMFLSTALYHREYKVPSKRGSMQQHASTLLSKANAESMQYFHSQQKGVTLKQYLNQVTDLILNTHDLLEHSWATEALLEDTKQNSMPVIFSLPNNLHVLEFIFASGSCTKSSLKEIMRHEELVRRSIDKLRMKISLSLQCFEVKLWKFMHR